MIIHWVKCTDFDEHKMLILQNVLSFMPFIHLANVVTYKLLGVDTQYVKHFFLTNYRCVSHRCGIHIPTNDGLRQQEIVTAIYVDFSFFSPFDS